MIADISRNMPSTNGQPRAVVSDTLVSRHSTDTMLCRSRTSDTYVILDPINQVSGTDIRNLLDEAIDYLLYFLSWQGDGPIPGGVFNWVGQTQLALHVANAIDRELTWEILCSAVEIIYEYMTNNGFGSITFSIRIGDSNEIAVGLIG